MRLLATLLFLGLIPLSALAQPINALYFTGSPSSTVTDGRTATIRAEDGYIFTTIIGTSFNKQYTTIQISNWTLSDHWQVSFQMPRGQSLVSGTYLNATRYPVMEEMRPGLYFSGSGGAVNHLGGKFTILEVSISKGQLVSLAADFTQYDDMLLGKWSYGSIRYKSEIPLNTLPASPAQPLRIACTGIDGNGPAIVDDYLHVYRSHCYASGGTEPYTWSYSDLPEGISAFIHNSLTEPSYISLSGNPVAGSFDYSVTVKDKDNGTASKSFSGKTTYQSCIPGGLFNFQSGPSFFGPSGGSSMQMGFSFSSYGCPWRLEADIPGVRFSPSSGSTGGIDQTIHPYLTVAANTGGAPLVGRIRLYESERLVHSYPIVVNSKSCSYTVDPDSVQLESQGGSGTFSITSNPHDCHAFKSLYSLLLNESNGLYYYSIDPNPGAARVGTFLFQNDDWVGGTAVANFSWQQEAGDGSLLINCYKPGLSAIGETIAICKAAGGTPPYSWSVIEGIVPGGVLDISDNGSSFTLGKPVEAGPFLFTVQVADSGAPSASVAYTVSGIVPPAPAQFKCSNSSRLKQKGAFYSMACTPISGTPPYQWSISEGMLPDGLTLSYADDGGAEISGVPSSAGNYGFTIQMTDSSTPAASTATQLILDNIVQLDPETPILNVGCTDNYEYFKILRPMQPILCSVFGGVAPYTWAIHKGKLPPGIELNSTTGSIISITGTPTEEAIGSTTTTYLSVTDGSAEPKTSLFILNPQFYEPEDFSCSPPNGRIDRYYSTYCTGFSSNMWISQGQLPPGLSLFSDGIAGTPTTPGVYAFSLTARNGRYPATSHSYQIVIEADAKSTVIIRTSPAGRSFNVDGMTYTESRTFSWVQGSSHTISVATLQQSDGTRYCFSSWSDGGASSHTIIAAAHTTTYTASFSTQYRLVISVSPEPAGHISVSPASADGFYDSGTFVHLVAFANEGYAYVNWSGDLAGFEFHQSIDVDMWGPRRVTASFRSLDSAVHLSLSANGAISFHTAGNGGPPSVGYAVLETQEGNVPYATAVFSYKQNGITVTEAGIPASPPTYLARIFIDYRTGVRALPAHENGGTITINTGLVVANLGPNAADVSYTLRDLNGNSVASGSGTIAGGRHIACFIDQLKSVASPDFHFPLNFGTSIQFGSLEIAANQPLSVLALRGTNNQRNDFLITTTPVADLLIPPDTAPIFFPQFVDGGGYTTSLILMNTTGEIESGTFEILDGNGNPLVVNQAGGPAGNVFRYSIPPDGSYHFQTDGAPSSPAAGWIRLIPDPDTNTPVGSGVFGFNPSSVMVSESGVPSVLATTHARIYVDLSRGHNTGLAIANVNNTNSAISIHAFQKDGVTTAGASREPLQLSGKGYSAAFADQFISDLPNDFTGVLDISASAPFAALTLRSLVNERGDFLMTTFPTADLTRVAPWPVVFPHIVDGGGYAMEFILISAGEASSSSLQSYDETGSVIDLQN